ncbi:hypothetical protein LTR33_000921 [Friedmanniomyces endolithicus]|nr:hypothetical protein LTR33_000921 [Friedmanniomyces endolithicus]
MPSARFCLPEHVDDDPSVQMDLFALGSTLYQIMTGRAPYADVSEEAVEERLVRHEFPSLLGIECGDAISKCWRGECLSALEIQDAIEDEIRSKRPSPLYDDVLEAFPGPGAQAMAAAGIVLEVNMTKRCSQMPVGSTLAGSRAICCVDCWNAVTKVRAAAGEV